MKMKVTKEGVLIPKEVTDRLGSEEVEVREEPGRLLISPATSKPSMSEDSPDRAWGESSNGEDSIFSMGEDPVDDDVTDASVKHDQYLYTGG